MSAIDITAPLNRMRTGKATCMLTTRFRHIGPSSMSIRSGTARISDVPDWDDAPPLQEGLSSFPGAHIQLLLPGMDEHG